MYVGRAAALAAVTAIGALTLTGCTSVEDQKVALTDVRDAYVTTGGTERPATEGATLAKGARVRTAKGGHVTLTVRGRRVSLAGETSVTVADGAHVGLARGALLVDRRRGPGLTIGAGDTTVDNVGQGALRVERSFSVLVAALSANARVRTATGPRLGLAPLYQVTVAGRALPQAASPLQLRDDAWERSVVAGLVRDDVRINDLAQGLRGPGAPVFPAVYRTDSGGRPADLVLADAIGRAAARDEPARVSAISQARRLRGDGGSWGVVAHLVGTTAIDVGTALSEVLSGVDATSPSPAPGTTSSPRPVQAGSTPQPGVTATPPPSGGSRSPGPTPTTKPPTSRPPTSPPPTSEQPDPVEQLFSALPTPPVLGPLLP
jgi:hypothetical protein